jgi:hypothetical protein
MMAWFYIDDAKLDADDRILRAILLYQKKNGSNPTIVRVSKNYPPITAALPEGVELDRVRRVLPNHFEVSDGKDERYRGHVWAQRAKQDRKTGRAPDRQ